MKLTITLSQALADPELFGKTFEAASFWTWRVVAKLIDGLPLDEGREVELFEQCTGRTQLPGGPVHRIVNLTGRRGGKDRFLSAVAVWRGALCCDWRKYMSAGESAVVLLLGADKKQAAILRRYCEGLLQQPRLRREILRQDRSVIEFRNGAVLEIATNDARLIRGRSAIAVLGSEASHWRTDEHAASSDEEVVGAATPSMAMCPDGGLLMLGSSVHRRRGYVYRKWKELYGRDDAEDIVWFAPSQVMNPSLPARAVSKALEEDAAKARAEFLNIWREDLSDFIPIDVVDACTDWGVSERPPSGGIKYFAWADAAGGTGRDSFALAIAHRESKDRVLVLDRVIERKPRFIASAVVAEFAAILRQYKIAEVWGDAFAGGFHADAWAHHKIKFRPAERTTSENYLTLLPLLTQPGRTRLLHDPGLRHQLAGLERRVHGGDRESVSHADTSNAHDDIAAAAAGALVLAATAATYNFWAPLGLGPDGEPLEGSGAPPKKEEPGVTKTDRHTFFNMPYIIHD
jgi:hypothetical protein